MEANNIELISLLSKLAAVNNLSLNKSDVRKRLALGLDEEQRKLLVVQKDAANNCNWRMISIDNIRIHFIKKNYRKIDTDALNKGILNEYLEKVTLHLDFFNCKQPFEIVFYDHKDHTVFELSQLMQFARDWDVILYKMRMRHTPFQSTFTNYKSKYWQGY